MPGLKERAKTLVELADAADFLYTDGPRALDVQAAKVLSPQGREILARLAPSLEAGDWTSSAIEQRVRQFAEESGLKLGQVAQPIRAAVTGKTTSPPVFDMLAVLGRQESSNRIRAYTQ
jgi:glutamyl-tRNA synthetase